ncbi:carbohydrate kinase [Rubellimicrobium sp. CFH 75288]|uniref:carbohydrate kinase family protein n=1 Tax=Rubellimicrobium sp. CFH 75288 TaxID=2697034 RepID=UPI001412DD14|nr:carbohydrate kinase [Rubellimicrobium sp. CFH 75288]NAZ36536.1 carbohydrate kinase [Rubellimicrobium sp. CFH 75288]
MILCCGEALIDMLPRTLPDGEAAFAPHAGGAVFNTAVALGRLGAPAGFLCGLSSDLFGDLLRETLAAAGVDSSLSPVSGRPTTLAFVRLRDGHASYTFYDEGTALRMLSPADLPALPPRVEALFLGGISLVGEPCGSAFEALQAREAGSRVTMLDPNVRPSFVADEGAYRARIDRMIARADILKVSDEDLRWLAGPGDPTDQARALLARGPRLVLVTRGAAGASGHLPEGHVEVEAPQVAVADTVGAGDTFNAGVLAALWRAGRLSRAGLAHLDEEALREALTLGVRAAAVTVSRPGANPPWAREL